MNFFKYLKYIWFAIAPKNTTPWFINDSRVIWNILFSSPFGNVFSTSNNGIKISNLDLSDEALPRVKVSGFNRTKSVDLENFLKTFTPQWRKFKLQKNATSGTFVFNTIEGK